MRADAGRFCSADYVHPDEGASYAQVAVTGHKPLRCPYCGDEFTADLQYVSGSYSEHRDLHGYECDNYRCDARWDKFGNPTRGPTMAEADSPQEVTYTESLLEGTDPDDGFYE